MRQRGPLLVALVLGVAVASAASWLTWPFGEPSPPPEPEMSEPAAPAPADETPAIGDETLAIAEDDEFGADWPRTAGWEETGYMCAACHSLAIVKQQGLTRKAWDKLLDWMVEEQGMAELEPEDRVVILDYLAQNFGVPETP